MPDLALCKNTTCPSNKKCYRFTATPNEFRQVYGDFTPEEDEVNCSFFIDNK